MGGGPGRMMLDPALSAWESCQLNMHEFCELVVKGTLKVARKSILCVETRRSWAPGLSDSVVYFYGPVCSTTLIQPLSFSVNLGNDAASTGLLVGGAGMK